MLRGLIAIIAGLMLVDAATTYGGIGVNLLFFADDKGLTPQEVFSYQIVAFYSIAMMILLTLSAFILFTDFIDLQFQFAKAMRRAVMSLLCLLAVIHVLAMMNVVRVADSELKGTFVDGTIYYALSTLGIVILLSIVHWLKVKTDKKR